ncbi:MAG: ribose 5-phosphate isomerase B [Phycisphaerae bacterium]|nr:MAG: ribose 5-phosphate isomerase B [Phycisphaerae bacterium]
MKVALACDHRGYECKRKLIPILRGAGHEVTDFGCSDASPSDYPDYAIPAAKAVTRGEVEVAILIDSSGIGMSVVANKLRGVRAAVVHDEVMARVARDANHCNVLCLGIDLSAQDQMVKIVETFLATPFSEGRHARRIEKINQLERELFGE